MIPKVLHQLWFTQNALSVEMVNWRLSWMKHNPDWSFKLWTLYDVLGLEMSIDMQLILNNPGIHYTLKTDVARFVILYNEGGIYADTDVECMKSFPKRMLEASSFCGRSHAPDGCGNAVIGSEWLNPIMKNIGTAITNAILDDVEKANRTIVDCSVRVAGELLEGCQVIYPVEYFYPFSWQQKRQGPDHYKKSEEYISSYCVHHFTSLDPNGWARQTILKDSPK